MKKKTLVMAALIALALCALAFSFLNSANRSNEAIRAEVLKATPIGCRIDAVKEYVETNLRGSMSTEPDDRTIEVSFPYGTYFELRSFPWPTTVSIQWQFSEANGKLENVQVIRRTR